LCLIKSTDFNHPRPVSSTTGLLRVVPFMPAVQHQYPVLSGVLILILLVIQVYMCLCVYWWHGAVMCCAVTQTHWTCLDSVNAKQVDLSLYIRQDYIQQSHPCMKTQPLLGLRLRATVRLNMLILLRVCYHSLQLQVRIVHSCPCVCVLPSLIVLLHYLRVNGHFSGELGLAGCLTGCFHRDAFLSHFFSVSDVTEICAKSAVKFQPTSQPNC